MEVARAEPVGKIGRIPFRFLLVEKWKKNVLIIYAPRECPSGSEGQTCKKGKFCRIPFRFLLVKKCTFTVLIIYAPRMCPSGSEG